MRSLVFFFVLSSFGLNAYAEDSKIDLQSTRNDKVVVTYETTHFQGNKGLDISAQVKSIDFTPNKPGPMYAEAYLDGKQILMTCGHDGVCRSGDLSEDSSLNLLLYHAYYEQQTRVYKHYLAVRLTDGAWLLDPMRIREDGSNDTAFELEFVMN